MFVLLPSCVVSTCSGGEGGKRVRIVQVWVDVAVRSLI